ncbi:ROK family protein [Virgibacillus halodenitrificans]|uniref:ROK family transcriptional regulator n=1 Tax=Virgibacillus halodenitrificans TaxID=1482 RepID=UPI001368DE01|nr:ROK family transcriptional regulator [Virgibacillus halodenitrificans]MYL46699.1 ROK family protein [Virgibacillus halodenitrificans]
MQRGTFQLMKSVNKSIILNKIRTAEPISRAQIAKTTKLTPPTVSSIVKELIEQGLVVERDSGQSMGGRKPTMLQINHTAFYIIGVDAGPDNIDVIIADLSGATLTHHSSQLQASLTNEEFLAQLKISIHAIIDDAPINGNEILGIGVAMHGVVDVETGTSLISPNLGLTNIPIKAELEKEFNVIIKVENDARAMALGEAWFGGHGEIDNMVAVNLGRGVGAGIVVAGKLYHGAQDIAGEIGHMTIDMNGKDCECGNRGCLQTFATGAAISTRAADRLQASESSLEHEPVFKLTGESVYALAKAGNKMYEEVLVETGVYIGVGLTNLIHLVNPKKVVLGGGVMNSAEFLLPSIQKTINQRALTTDAKQTEVVVTSLGEDATLLGAVSLLLVELFEVG